MVVGGLERVNISGSCRARLGEGDSAPGEGLGTEALASDVRDQPRAAAVAVDEGMNQDKAVMQP